MRLDHVSYAVAPSEFVDTVQRIGAVLGAPLVDGGRHPRFGTRNFVLPLNGGTYLEVVTYLEHPATDGSPFGRAVKSRVDEGSGWLGWVVAVDDIEPLEQRLGRESVEGHRVRPDGYDLKWKQLGVNGLLADPQLPFFIEWSSGSDQHPSVGASAGLELAALEIAGDPAVVGEWLGVDPEHPLEDVAVSWATPDDETGAGIVSATFHTEHGDVVLD